VSLQAEVEPSRAVAALRELHELTADAGGAQRVAWTETWREARKWLHERLERLGAAVTRDAAGNIWATLDGDWEEAVLIGGHLDSVPGGGWLDGTLNLLAGVETLEALATRGRLPVTVRLVDWADEEGARFGYGMIGSSAASGTLDLERVATLRDRDGIALPDALDEHGVRLDAMLQSGEGLRDARAYIELHIEQGPVLERLGLPLAVVLGTCGVERHLVHFTGQAAHAGSTPMEVRRDAFLAAGRLALAVRDGARGRDGAVATTGRCSLTPGIVTAVAGECVLSVDQRHLDADVLEGLLADAKRVTDPIAAEERVTARWEPLWRIEPIAFDPALIELADEAVREVAGSSHRMSSGPLHDAVEVARAGVPTVMLFVQSLHGLSHTKEEDTREEHLELAVRALAATVERTMAQVAEDRVGSRPSREEPR
jgi:allantoate deiminase